ncbi:MAG: VWA domain-containing protein [Verrucomicrobium sp.]|nr:VWA domain-containing protein [Verrucomicrobium sp.]
MKPLEEIRAEPLTRLRSDLFNAFKTKQVSREFLANFLLRLEKELPGGENLPELGNIQNALQNGQVDIPPDLNSPANALAWGALFSHLQQQPDAMQAWPENRRAPTLKESPLWKQAIQSPRANFEKIQSASLLLDLVNDSVRLGWGPPGSWYCFLPEEKRINIDFLNTLIFGFEHSRSIVVHEIAHSLLSKEFPPAMTALREKMAALKKTGKTRPLTQDEYKELRLADTEWKLRHGITNPAEDNCVNRYAAIQGERLDGVSQHYGTSLNYIETLLISQKAEAFPTGPKGDLANLGHAVNMAFFSRNGLFQDTREGWTQSGVEVDRITRPGAGPSAVPPYRELAERLHTLASLQPDLQLRVWERGYGQDYYAAKTLDLCRRRNEIIDRIWDDYAAPFAQELLDAKEEEIEKKLQQNPSQEQQNSQGQGRGGGGEEQDSGSGGMGEEEEGGETLEVEGAGQQPSPQLPPRTPDQENAETAPGEDKDQSGPKQEADEEKTLRELIEEGQKQAKAEDRAREEREKQAQDLRATSAQSMSAGPGIDELPVGSWEDYAAEVARLAGPIRFVAQQLKQIQEKQLQSIQAPSRQRTLLPADGDFERFLPKAWDQLGEKKLSGNVQLRDYHLFRADHEKFKPSSIDAVILIDGSGSMRSWSWGEEGKLPTPEERALQTAIIFYEATRLLNRGNKGSGIDTYVGIWGPPQPFLIAKPGDDHLTIGKTFAGLKEGLSSGTTLAPALQWTASTLGAKKPHPDAVTGFTHLHIISDGDIYDDTASKAAFEHLFSACDLVTTDVAILNRKGNTPMEKLAANVRTVRPTQRIDVTHGKDPAHVSSQMLEALLGKMRACKSFVAVPASSKQAQFRRAERAMILAAENQEKANER